MEGLAFITHQQRAAANHMALQGRVKAVIAYLKEYRKDARQQQLSLPLRRSEAQSLCQRAEESGARGAVDGLRQCRARAPGMMRFDGSCEEDCSAKDRTPAGPWERSQRR